MLPFLNSLKAFAELWFCTKCLNKKAACTHQLKRARAKTRVFPEQACAMVFSPEVAITIFSPLISPNLAVQPMFKFLLLTENTKTETWTFFFKENLSEFFFRNFQIRQNFPIFHLPNFSLTEFRVLPCKYLFLSTFQILKVWSGVVRLDLEPDNSKRCSFQAPTKTHSFVLNTFWAFQI